MYANLLERALAKVVLQHVTTLEKFCQVAFCQIFIAFLPLAAAILASTFDGVQLSVAGGACRSIVIVLSLPMMSDYSTSKLPATDAGSGLAKFFADMRPFGNTVHSSSTVGVRLTELLAQMRMLSSQTCKLRQLHASRWLIQPRLKCLACLAG